jgi:hypothetical protein
MAMLMFLVLAWLPAVIAELRKHRHPLLVSLVGFLAILIHPVLWLGALLWAWKGPTRPTTAG